MRLHGRVICYPESRSDCQTLTNAAESYLATKARSSNAVEDKDKYKLTISLDDFEQDDAFDPWDLACFLWDAIGEYCWVGIFFSGEGSYEERFSYEDYSER